MLKKIMSGCARPKLLGLLLLSVLACSSLRADFLTISQPTASYLAGTTLLDFTDPDETLIGGLAGGGETLIYGNNLVEYTVPGSWGAWNTPPAVETAVPRVGYTDGFSSLVIGLSAPASTFGVEVEPDLFNQEQMTASFYSNTSLVGTIDLSLNGNAGALLFAASTTTNPFTTVVITNLADDDFAIARQRVTLADAPAPEPASFFLAAAALLPLAWFARRGASRPHDH